VALDIVHLSYGCDLPHISLHKLHRCMVGRHDRVLDTFFHLVEQLFLGHMLLDKIDDWRVVSKVPKPHQLGRIECYRISFSLLHYFQHKDVLHHKDLCIDGVGSCVEFHLRSFLNMMNLPSTPNKMSSIHQLDMDVNCTMIVWIRRHDQHKHLHHDYIVFFFVDSCFLLHMFLSTPHFANRTILTNMVLLLLFHILVLEDNDDDDARYFEVHLVFCFYCLC